MIQIDGFGERSGAKRCSHAIAALVALLILTLPTFTFAAPSADFRGRASILAQKTLNSYGEMIDIAALLHDEDKNLIASVIVVESEGNTRAVSRRGAEGLMQLMPATARAMGAKDPKEPMDNILAGTKYIKHLRQDYGFTTAEALVAYNMGPTRAKRWLSQYEADDFGYVQKVLFVYDVLKDEEEEALALQHGPVENKNVLSLAIRAVADGAKPLLTKPRLFSLASLPVGMHNDRRQELITE